MEEEDDGGGGWTDLVPAVQSPDKIDSGWCRLAAMAKQFAPSLCDTVPGGTDDDDDDDDDGVDEECGRAGASGSGLMDVGTPFTTSLMTCSPWDRRSGAGSGCSQRSISEASAFPP
jgi:hypothetical protein